MKAIFLVIDYVPHQILSIKTMIDKNNVEVLAFHVGRFHHHIPTDIVNFSTYQYQSFSKKQFFNKIKVFDPDIVIVAGWMIPEYTEVCKYLKKHKNIPIVAYSDTPWYATWKQKLNVLMSPLHIRKAFTHLWVAGIKQYDYARKLGFTNEQIIFNSLSADISIFHKIDIDVKEKSYPKNFLYIGRYAKIKGLNNLMQAWSTIIDKKGWTFTLVGAGEMKEELLKNDQFIVKDYMDQNLLLQEMQNAGCFVLPSLREPWALVIHEAVAGGLPILCTETCGAALHFVINNFNGFRVKDNSIKGLKDKLEFIINADISVLLAYSRKSRELSNAINPDIQAASLMQLIYAD